MKRDTAIDMRSEIPSSLDSVSCIYMIWCFASNKGYVGSAVNLGRRIRKHRASLRGKYHANRHLQSAYNLYGESSFGVFMIEDCGEGEILQREQHWIDELKSSDKNVGYNLSPVAGSRLGAKLTEEQKKNISLSIKAAVSKNPEAWKSGGHKRRGRKLSNEHVAKVVNACSKSFSLKSPRGEVFCGKNRAEFCRKNGLNKSGITMLISGKYPNNNYRGWTLASC